MSSSQEVPNNEHISWSGTRYGYHPNYSEEIGNIVKHQTISKPALLSALLKKHKFIAAHVILTLSGEMKFETFPTWNKLKIDIAADGTVKIDPEQRYELLEYWENNIGSP